MTGESVWQWCPRCGAVLKSGYHDWELSINRADLEQAEARAATANAQNLQLQAQLAEAIQERDEARQRVHCSCEYGNPCESTCPCGSPAMSGTCATEDCPRGLWLKIHMLRADVRAALAALRKIKDESAPRGSDWGDSRIHRIATDALALNPDPTQTAGETTR